jgi:hypothetical protein
MFSQEERASFVRPRVVAAIVMTLLLHLGFVMWLLRPAIFDAQLAPNRASDASHRLRLRFFSLHLPAHQRQILNKPAVAIARNRDATHPAVSHVAPRASLAVQTTQSIQTSAASSLSLFNPDGSIRMANVAMKLRDADAADMRHFQQLPCHGTRFSERWSRGQNESLGNEMARKYLAPIGLYNPATEAAYQKRRAYLDEACAH